MRAAVGRIRDLSLGSFGTWAIALAGVFMACYGWFQVVRGFSVQSEALAVRGEDVTTRILELGLVQQQATFVIGAVLGILLGSNVVVLGWLASRAIAVRGLWKVMVGSALCLGWGVFLGVVWIGHGADVMW